MRLAVPPAPFYAGAEFFEDYDLPLRVIHVDGSPVFPRHRHEFHELVVVCSGTAKHLVDESEYTARQGDVFFIPKGSYHEYADLRDFCYINVIFGASLWEDSNRFDPELFRLAEFPNKRCFRLSAFGARETVSIINRIDQELFNKREHYAFMARSCFMQLWGTLARRGSCADVAGASSAARVRRVVEALEHEYCLPVSVTDMAAEAAMCVRNFHRIFNSIVGYPPLAYVNRLRVKTAADLLRETDKTVAQIAALVGYDDSNYFTRQFRQSYGCSPSKYRET